MGFRSYIREFFGAVLELARPSEAWCFPAGRYFFGAVLRLAAAGNRICRKSVEKCCFSRISDDALGNFLARFWNLLILQRHGVSLPGGDFFEAVLLLAAARLFGSSPTTTAAASSQLASIMLFF